MIPQSAPNVARKRRQWLPSGWSIGRPGLPAKFRCWNALREGNDWRNKFVSEQADLVMVVADLGAGGAQRVVLRAAEAFTTRGYRVAIVTLSGPELDFYKLPAGV